MELSGRIVRQMILFTLIVLIIPMILFPNRLGTELFRGSIYYGLFELLFYGIVLYIFNRDTSLINLIKSAGLCLVARLLIGAVYGLLIIAMYPMNFSIAMTLATSSYLPAVLLHITATPFILKPLFSEDEERTSRPRSRQSMTLTSDFTAKPQPAKKGVQHDTSRQQQTDFSSFNSRKRRSESNPKQKMENGFQNAVQYIGEYGSVLMAAVIDHEGLLMAGFHRSRYEPEDFAPFALPIMQGQAELYKKMKLPIPEKTDMQFETNRMIIASEKYYSLIVISERTADDVLNIRINQALEMIKTYTAERYSEKLIGNAERIYV